MLDDGYFCGHFFGLLTVDLWLTADIGLSLVSLLREELPGPLLGDGRTHDNSVQEAREKAFDINS